MTNSAYNTVDGCTLFIKTQNRLLRFVGALQVMPSPITPSRNFGFSEDL